MRILDGQLRIGGIGDTLLVKAGTYSPNVHPFVSIDQKGLKPSDSEGKFAIPMTRSQVNDDLVFEPPRMVEPEKKPSPVPLVKLDPIAPG